MKFSIWMSSLGLAAVLSACGNAAPDGIDTPQTEKTEAPHVKGVAEQSLDEMDMTGLLELVGTETDKMKTVLQGVTDGLSAKVARADVRTIAPRLNAAFASLSAIEGEALTASESVAMMSKMPDMLNAQRELMKDLQRIYDIPEARAVLESEFEGLELFK